MPTAPAFSALYLLSEPESGKAFRGAVVDEDGLIDGVVRGHLERPLMIRHAGGSEAQDFIWTDEGVVCVSERVIRTLRVNAITGWETFDVHVSTRAGRRLPGYAGLRITGSCGPIDFSASEPLGKITPLGLQTAFLGRYFDRASWDGSLMFSPVDSDDIMITQRVADTLTRALIRNVRVRSLDGVEVPGAEVDAWRARVGAD